MLTLNGNFFKYYINDIQTLTLNSVTINNAKIYCNAAAVRSLNANAKNSTLYFNNNLEESRIHVNSLFYNSRLILNDGFNNNINSPNVLSEKIKEQFKYCNFKHTHLSGNPLFAQKQLNGQSFNTLVSTNILYYNIPASMINKHFVNYNNFLVCNIINIGQYLLIDKDYKDTVFNLTTSDKRCFYELNDNFINYAITFENPYNINYNYNLWLLNSSKTDNTFSGDGLINGKYFIKLPKTTKYTRLAHRR